MTAKAILDIDVDPDGNFAKFNDLFSKYRAAVSDLPGDWGKVGTAAKAAGNDFGALVLAAQRTAAATEKMAEAQNSFTKATASSSHAMDGLARNTKDVAGNIMAATTSLLKWTGILGAVGGLLGAGGIWGIDRLAQDAAAARKGALGQGTTTAGSQAFAINYRRAVDDPNSFLNGIAGMKSDQSEWRVFNALQIADFQDRDPADLAPEMIEKARAIYARNPTTQTAHAYGLDLFASGDELRRWQGIEADEFSGMRSGMARDRSTLDMDPGTLKAWTEFSAQLERAGTTIENVFIKGLVPLSPALGDVSKAFTDLLSAGLKEAGPWLKTAAAGLEEFAKFIGTPAFKSDVEGFVAGVGRLGHTITDTIAWINSKLPGGTDTIGLHAWLNADSKNSAYNFQTGGMQVGQNSATFVDKSKSIHDYFIAQGYPEAAVDGILGNLQAESGFDTTAWNKAGGGLGHQGLAQWGGDRIAAFSNAFGHDPRLAPQDEQLSFLAYELRTSHKSAGDALMAAKDPKQAADSFRQLFEIPGDNGDAPKREAFAEQFSKVFGKPGSDVSAPTGAVVPPHFAYQGGTPPLHADPAAGKPSVRLDINNNTGGSAIVSVGGASRS